ncbi:MAG TPA: DUF167 domain-containing protein [Candidatus Methanoculleus thermohydrogenotrophicum]|jgi:uncharacterized protein (TIGR00251 family)|nr:DUF167 domain-containing protein [Candidatus Methanoculleus thermohydrogenotrophicum]NLM82092.1 YggU family protein [Candidatus Methanoculleus thermohydrogenotrophicum]HOB18097.1 DUF167 domain-containing protein [Candidatus Methanoculleus thermohydrogenotrophicum]HPZ37813.1 DUF167 domain-containing protein [Candidatus Methanoculleus thermohydrogenotrophicum]
MEPYADAITETGSGVTIVLDVTAGAKRASFPAGYNEWRKSIRCQVAAPALGGKANRAIIDLVAETLGVSRADVSIISGHTSTSKTVAVAGLSKSEIIALLSASGA